MQTMDVSDIKKDAISLWFSDDNTNFYGIELTDKAYSKDGIVWHFAYVNRNNPEEYWNNQSKDCEYRVVSWRKEKSSNNDDVYLLEEGSVWRQSYRDLDEAINMAMKLAE